MTLSIKPAVTAARKIFRPVCVERMNRFQAGLTRFEPTTEGQKILHAETLRAYSLLIRPAVCD